MYYSWSQVLKRMVTYWEEYEKKEENKLENKHKQRQKGKDSL